MKKSFTEAAENNTLSGNTYLKNGVSLIGLMTVRLVLLCVLTCSMMWFFCDIYMLEVRMTTLIPFTAIMTAGLYILISCFKGKIVYGGYGILYLCTFLSMARDFEEISYLTGAHFMFYMDGRFFRTARYVEDFRNADELYSYYWQGRLTEANTTLMLLIAGAVVAFCVFVLRRRLNVIPVVLFIVVLIIPAFFAERITFFNSFAFVFASCFALHAVRSSEELKKIYVFGSRSVAESVVKKEEADFRKSLRGAKLGNRLRAELTRYCRYNANAVIAFVVSTAVMLSVFAVSGKGNYIDYTEFFKQVEETFNSISIAVGDLFSVSFGEVSDNGYFADYESAEDAGDISINAPSEGNLPVLKVVTGKSSPVYLRGDIGVTFSDNTWKTFANDDYYNDIELDSFSALAYDTNARELEDFHSEIQYQVLRQRLSAAGYKPYELLPLEKVSITYQRNTRVVFQPLYPYESDYSEGSYNYRNNENFDCFGDFVLRLKKHISGIKTYESFALLPLFENFEHGAEALEAAARISDYDEAFNYRWTLPEGIDAADYTTELALYDDFVKTTYLAVPETEQENIQNFLLSNESYFLQSDYVYDFYNSLREYYLAQDICKLFRNNYRYSLTVDNDSGENTKLGNFLFETREGHCALYATAMTLALRELGVPARYVTGYVAGSEGTKITDGYEYIMRESDLHAWVEVYITALNVWGPFDPTPPAVMDGTDITAPDMPEITTPSGTTTEKPENTTTTAVQPSDTSDTTEYRHDNPFEIDVGNFDPIILVYAVSAVLVLMVIALVLAYYRSLLGREMRLFRVFAGKEPRNAVKEMHKFITRLLAKNELIRTEGELPRMFAVRVDKNNPCGSKNFSYRHTVRIIEKAEFGKPEISPVTEDERQLVLAYVTKLYEETVLKKKRLKRILLKISLFS